LSCLIQLQFATLSLKLLHFPLPLTFFTSSGVSNKRCAASSAQTAAAARESFYPALLFTIPFIIMSNALPPPLSSSSFRHNAAARATPPPAIAQRLAAAQLGSKTATSSSAANSSSSSSSQTAPSPHPRTHFLSSNAHELASDPTGASLLLPRTKSSKQHTNAACVAHLDNCLPRVVVY
jgi:hypothetical protein